MGSSTEKCMYIYRHSSALLMTVMFISSAGWAAPTPFEDVESNLWGYRTDGQIAIPPKYYIATDFNEYGIAAVADSSGWRYIDTDGNLVVTPFLFDNGPDPFVEGLARYVEENKIGFFDATGRRLIPARYDFATPFSQGLSAVCSGCAREFFGEHYRYVGGKWGYIDYLGNEVIPLQYEAAAPFAEGNARVRLDGAEKSIELPEQLPRWARYRGFLPTLVLQHPLLITAPDAPSPYAQFYLDIAEGSKSQRQIIVLHPREMEIPTQGERQIEVTGLVTQLSLGGAPGTKESYRNEVLKLTSWRYVDISDGSRLPANSPDGRE